MATDTAAKTQPEPVMLSDLQERIIRACLRYQFTTVLDIALLLGCPPTLNHYRRVMAGLSGGKKDMLPGHFLFKWALPKTRFGNATRVFVPGQASRALLDQWEDKDDTHWNYPARMQSYSYSYVYHNLAVTRLAICMALFVRAHPAYTLEELRLWYDMASSPPRLSLETEGEQRSLSVIPDCWVYLKRVADGRGHVFWFEIDNSTTFRQTFLRRARARLSLCESEAYEHYFGTAAVVLYYAVIGKDQKRREDRRDTLAEWTNDFLVKEEREEWVSKFRFAAIDYETLYEEINPLFTASIWHGPGKPGKTSAYPLLPPLPALPATEQTDAHNNTANHTHPHP